MSHKSEGIILQLSGLAIIAVGMWFLSFVLNDDYGVWLSILGFACFTLGSSVLKFGRRIKQPAAEDLLKQDNRQPILLLRSFKRDDLDIKESTDISESNMFHPNFYIDHSGYTFEEKLIEMIDFIGPAIAIGRPNEKIQPLGASRTYVHDSKWQKKIIDLANKSSYVFILLDISPSLEWEIITMYNILRKNQIILIIPNEDDIEYLLEIEKLLKKVEIEFNITKNTVAITHDDDNKVIEIISMSNKQSTRIKSIKSYLSKVIN